jgi:ribonuclease H2 subunit A
MGLLETTMPVRIGRMQAFIDTVGDAESYKRRLSTKFPGIEFTVCPKADSLYPIVSVASIVAKVVRDSSTSLASGSGYPSDPATKQWLKENIDEVFAYPSSVRCGRTSH